MWHDAGMKIVIVAHEFMPSTSAGAVRPHVLAKGLGERGHDVIVVTAEADPATGPYRAFSVPYTSYGSMVKRAAGMGAQENAAEAAARRGRASERLVRTAARTAELFMVPDKQHRWRAACRRWLKDEGTPLVTNADVVVGTTPPLTALLAAADVERAVGALLVADFRDLWTQNPRYPFGVVRRQIDRRVEARLLGRARLAVAVNDTLAASLKEASPTSRIEVVTTGVDGTAARGAPGPAGVPFRLAYSGITYTGERDLRPFLDAIGALGGTGRLDASRVQLDVFGDADSDLTERATALGVSEALQQHGFLARAEHEAALSKIHVAICPLAPKDKVALPLKMMEYLAAGRTIVVTGTSPDWELERRLRDTPGVHFVHSQADLESTIAGLWTKWLSGDTLFWSPECRANPFSARATVDAYETLLERMRDS